MVLTEQISLTVSTLGGCDGPDRTDFFNSSILGGCGGGLARTNFSQFLLWEGVVVLHSN